MIASWCISRVTGDSGWLFLCNMRYTLDQLSGSTIEVLLSYGMLYLQHNAFVNVVIFLVLVNQQLKLIDEEEYL